MSGQTLALFVDLCLRVQRSGIALTLFASLKLSTPADLTNICNPVLERLQPILQAYNFSFSQAPMLDFAQNVLSFSVRTYLGPLTTAPLNLSISSTIINPEKWDVNAFLADPARHVMRISALSSTRAKTESSLNKFVRAGVLLPMETTKHRSPYTLVIRKKVGGLRLMSLQGVPSEDQVKAWMLARQECDEAACRQCASLSLLIERADGRARVKETVKAIGELLLLLLICSYALIGGAAVAMEILRDDLATLQLMHGVIDGITYRPGKSPKPLHA